MSWPPKKNQAVSVEVLIRDADGDPVTTGTLSSTMVQDGVAAAGPTPVFVSGGGGIITVALTLAQNNFDRMALIIFSSAGGAKSAYIAWFNVTSQIDDLSTQVSVNAVPTAVENRQEMDSNSTKLSEVTPARMSELDEATAGKMANQLDLVKTETDKIALADAGAGASGSVIEEVENRATVTALGTAQAGITDIQSRIPLTLVVGRMDSDVGAKTGNVPLSAQEKLDVNAEADTAATDFGALRPTTAGRTLDVTATGEAGLDLDNTVGALAKGTEIAGFNDITAAQVNAEMDTALNTASPGSPTANSIYERIATMDGAITEARLSELDDAAGKLVAIADLIKLETDKLDASRSEPGQGSPAVSQSILLKIDYLYKFMRNKKTQSATSFEVFDDTGLVVDHKATASDAAGVTTIEEVVSGP